MKMSEKKVDGYFVTYVSTSWRKEVSLTFIGNNNGMMIEFDRWYRRSIDFDSVYCCDVSWISKFPDECEILFARSVPTGRRGKFECVVLDDSNGIQTVSLKEFNIFAQK